MTATRADDAGGSATATTDLDPNSAWGDGDAAVAAHDFDPISDWDGGDEVTVASALLPHVVDLDPTSGLPDRGLDVGASADAHSSATKKRRRKYNRETQDSQKHRRRMATFATARGSAPGSDPGPIGEYPGEDWAER